MGRKAEILEGQVIEAGEALEAEGKSVTGWALRTWLGGGKPERLIQVWRAANGEAPQDGPLSEATLLVARDGLRAALDGAIGTALDGIQIAARATLDAAEAKAQAVITEATRDAAAAVAVLEAELDRVAVRLGNAERRCGRLEVDAATAKAEAHDAQQLHLDAQADIAVLKRELASQAALLAVSEERARAALERAEAAEARERAALERAAMAEATLAVLGRKEGVGGHAMAAE